MAVELTWNDFIEETDKKQYKLEKELPLKKRPSYFLISEDNYPALKALAQFKKEFVNLIYIDPPYNTGKKIFTYNDNFISKKKKTEQDSDRHSIWLSFMQRRLSLAQELLSKDGCIFISIGQEELYVLKLLCDKIFGEENFINDFMYLHGKGKKDLFSRTLQQSTLCYAKDKKNLKPFCDCKESNWAKSNLDNDKRGNWFSGSVSFSEKRSNKNHKNYYAITSPSGITWLRQWFYSEEKMKMLIEQNKIYWGKAPEYDQVPREKIFNGEKKEIIPQNIIDSVQSTRNAQNYLDSLLEEKNSFDNPKPVDLIEHLIKITNMKKNITVLDFFAGSGTTLEAVFNLNKKDGGKRNCILIQKPEPISNGKSRYKNIAELCKARALKVLGNSNVLQECIIKEVKD